MSLCTKLLFPQQIINKLCHTPKITKCYILHQKNTRLRLAMSSSTINTPKSELSKVPGVTSSPDHMTKDFIFQQTMYRIKDPKASLDFYTRILGMTLLSKFDFAEMKFTIFMLGYAKPEDIPDNKDEHVIWMSRQKSCLELTHNWGTESDPNFIGYHNGNTDPRGFGHIGIAVPDVEAACERFEKLGVTFSKKPDDGKMKGLAFIKDPDGYSIEIFNGENLNKII